MSAISLITSSSGDRYLGPRDIASVSYESAFGMPELRVYKGDRSRFLSCEPKFSIHNTLSTPKEGLNFIIPINNQGQVLGFIPEAISRAIGLASENVLACEVLKGGSIYTHTTVLKIDKQLEDGREISFVLKYGPESEMEREKIGHTQHLKSSFSDLVLPHIVGKVVDQSNELGFVVMPYLDSDKYVDVRTALASGLVSQEQAEKIFVELRAMYLESLRTGVVWGKGDIFSMQLVEHDEYLKVLAELPNAISRASVQIFGRHVSAQDIMHSNLVFVGEDGVQIHESIYDLSMQLNAIINDAKAYYRPGGIGKEDDNSLKNKYIHLPTGMVIAQTDPGYCAKPYEINPMGTSMTTFAKGPNRVDLIIETIPNVVYESRKIIIQGMKTFHAPLLEVWEKEAMSHNYLSQIAQACMLPESAARKIIRGHMGVNWISSISPLLKGVESPNGFAKMMHVLENVSLSFSDYFGKPIGSIQRPLRRAVG